MLCVSHVVLPALDLEICALSLISQYAYTLSMLCLCDEFSWLDACQSMDKTASSSEFYGE